MFAIARNAACAAAILTLGLSVLAAGGAETPRDGGYVLSGPYVHDNLAVYLIHGEDRVKGREFLTLQEAVAKGLVVVHETGDVNELVVENRGKIDVFIQYGDIVKGGKQDRTIAVNFILPPGARGPVEAFCVEQGRWSQRGQESPTGFNSADFALSGKAVKLATVRDKRQDAVWREVARQQVMLEDNLGVAVRAPESASSYQLALENKALNERVEKYMAALAGAIDGRNDVIGCAVAINGKVTSADVYASSGLFRKLWPRLLRAASVEAISELKKGEKFQAPAAEEVRARMQGAEAAAAAPARDVGGRVRMITREDEKTVLVETRDKEAEGQPVHRSYLAK